MDDLDRVLDEIEELEREEKSASESLATARDQFESKKPLIRTEMEAFVDRLVQRGHQASVNGRSLGRNPPGVIFRLQTGQDRVSIELQVSSRSQLGQSTVADLSDERVRTLLTEGAVKLLDETKDWRR
jgi:hypothetical protein